MFAFLSGMHFHTGKVILSHRELILSLIIMRRPKLWLVTRGLWFPRQAGLPQLPKVIHLVLVLISRKQQSKMKIRKLIAFIFSSLKTSSLLFRQRSINCQYLGILAKYFVGAEKAMLMSSISLHLTNPTNLVLRVISVL